jgi:hypothetical protein
VLGTARRRPGTLVSLLAPAALDDSPASPVLRQGSCSSALAPGLSAASSTRGAPDARGAFRFALDGPGTYAVAVLSRQTLGARGR